MRLTTGSTQGMKLRTKPAANASSAAFKSPETSRAGVNERGESAGVSGAAGFSGAASATGAAGTGGAGTGGAARAR